MIDYTANTVESIGRMWSWRSASGGAAPEPDTAAVYEFAQWFGDHIGFFGWSWVSEAGGAPPVDPGGADDYIIRARRRGRR